MKDNMQYDPFGVEKTSWRKSKRWKPGHHKGQKSRRN